MMDVFSLAIQNGEMCSRTEIILQSLSFEVFSVCMLRYTIWILEMVNAYLREIIVVIYVNEETALKKMSLGSTICDNYCAIP